MNSLQEVLIRGALKVDRLGGFRATKSMINQNLEGCARFVRVDIRKKDRAAEVVIELHGESEPLEVIVEEYQVSRGEDGVQVKVVEAHTSKPWITALLYKFVVGKPLAISSEYQKLVKDVLG